MIEGCIVAKLVLGYLKQEGLYRTCSAFQEEYSLFRDNNKELDNVFLTADLKTILDDYSQLRETGLVKIMFVNISIYDQKEFIEYDNHPMVLPTKKESKGRENGLPSSTAVLKSLWKDLDVVIGQLKYATIPSNTPKPSTSQSTRTRRFNNARARRSVLPRTQESFTSPTLSPSTAQLPMRPNVNNTTEKLPLPRLSNLKLPPDLLKSSSKNHSPILQFSSTGRVALNGNQLTANKESVNVHRTPSTVQSIGSAVAITSPCVSAGSQAAKTSTDVTSTVFSIGNSNGELSRNDDIVEGMFNGMDDGSVFNDQECSDSRTENKTPPVIVIDSNERIKEQGLLSHSQQSQSELHLRSPKRKGIQPKKRIPQGATCMSTVHDSPVKLVPESDEVEVDLICSSDSLTPQSFLGTLLNTPLLQERLAENINKVVGSTRQHPVTDEAPSDSMQTLTTTEASSDDMLMESNQGAGGDIPVKEIMDLMQGDPAFDVLFSFFGLDALGALPSAANAAADSNASTVLPETSAGSSQPDKSTSCVSSSGTNLADALEASPFPEECQSLSRTEITPMVPTTLDQQVETPRSSSASDLHLSATSIVTDALLLLAGSPQKIPPQSQSQLDRSASVLTSGKRNPVTPPKKTRSVQEQSANDKRPRVDSLPSQTGLITSTFPYVRALDFNVDKGLEPVKRSTRKASKNKKGAKQKTATDQQSKAPLPKKAGQGNKRHSEASKSTPSSNTAVGYGNTQAVPPLTVVTNVNSGISPPFPNCDSAFNQSSNSIPFPVSLVVSSVCHNTSPYNAVSCDTLTTRSPISVCNQTTTPSTLPGNLVRPSAVPAPPTIACTNPGSDPSTSLVTLVNPLNYPVNFTSAAASHPSSSVNGTSFGNGPVSANHSHSSSCLTPSAVNLSSYSSVPFIHSSAGSVFTPAPGNVVLQHTTVAPRPVGFINPTTCPVPSLSVTLANGTNSNPAFPTSHPVSSLSSLPHIVNTVASSPLTEPTQAVIPGQFNSLVVSSTTSSSNSLTSQGQNAGILSRTRTSTTDAVVTQATNTVVTPAIVPGVTQQALASPLSLHASNLLQSIAVQHINTEKNEPSDQSVTDVRKENTQGCQENVTLSPLARGQQPLKDKSKEIVNLSKDGTIMPSEKHKDEIYLVCKSPSTGPVEKGFRDDDVTVVECLPNSPENKNGGTSALVQINQGCRELMKENSAGFLQTGTSSETEGQELSKPSRKRRRDALQKEKEKKTKSTSRPSKRSKTKAESINFPSDLNVEEFLSKLHYEVK